jgi:predicted nucleotidyltransferase
MRERVVDELRPLLARRWIERKRSQPPTQFYAAVPSSGSKDELDSLLRRWVVTHDASPYLQAGR